MAKIKAKKQTIRKAKSSVKKLKAKNTRVYNNESRVKKSEVAQKKIIETVVAFLVERKGGEVNMNEISKRSKISERTIFRFFKDKQALHEATNRYLQSFLKEGTEKLHELNVEGFAKNTFELFEKHESLLMAYLFSPFGQQARDIFRKQVKHELVQKIIKDRSMSLSGKRNARLQFAVALINARLWYEIKEDSHLSSTEIGEAASWALEVLLDRLND